MLHDSDFSSPRAQRSLVGILLQLSDLVHDQVRNAIAIAVQLTGDRLQTATISAISMGFFHHFPIPILQPRESHKIGLKPATFFG